MRIQTLRLRNHDFGDQWPSEIENRWHYQDFKNDPEWRENWISFDCIHYDALSDRLYLGVASFAADIFHAYDRRRGRFVDLGYRRIADPFDAKFHRSLVRRPSDGCLYGAIALFHDIDRYYDAPGGAIVRYDPETGALDRLAVPLPHVYIQAICLDAAGDAIYCVTFTPERLIRYCLPTGKAEDLGPLSSGFEFTQGQNIVLDDEGCAWMAWSLTRAWQDSQGPDSKRLCKYDPKAGRIRFFQTGLPRRDGCPGYEKLDGLFNLGDGFLYAGGGNGCLYRIDTESGRAELIAAPIENRPSRLSSLAIGPDGAAWGVTGMKGDCDVIRFEPRTGRCELVGKVTENGTRCWQVHDVAFSADGVLYACENDNPRRSSFLWEIEL